MDIATIMVPMGRTEARPEELELVSTFAQRFGARIIGVMAREVIPRLYYEAGIVAGDIIEDRQGLREVMGRPKSGSAMSLALSIRRSNGDRALIGQRTLLSAKRVLRI